MSREYVYDQTGIFYYFLFSLLVMYLIPSTFWKISKFSKKDKNDKKTDSDDYSSKIIKLKEDIKAKSSKETRRSGLDKSDIIWIICWILLIGVGYRAFQIESEEKVEWDPFVILGVQPGVTEAEIKAAYKALSLKWHPDKNKGNEEEANAKFVEISKAYKTLTDEETRESWEKYGNPDNIKDIKMGIALPEWIVRKENSVLVLAIYISFMLIIVAIVGYWWFGNKKKDNEEISPQNSEWLAARFVTLIRNKAKPTKISKAKVKSNYFAIEDVIKELYLCPEFQENVKYNPSEDDELLAKWSNKNVEGFQFFSKMIRPELRKALIFLYMHLTGQETPSKYKQESDLVIIKSVRILKLMISMNLQLRCFSACQKAILLQQYLTQGSWEKDHLKAPFSQIPHFNEAILNEFNSKDRKEKITTIGRLMILSEENRRNTLKDLNDKQYSEFMEIASQIPVISISSSSFKVLNETEMRVGDVVTYGVNVKVTYGPINEKNSHKEEEEKEKNQEEKNITTEEDIEEILAEKKKKNKIDLSNLLPVYAPKFPEARYPCWWVILTNEKEQIIGYTIINEYTTSKTVKEGQILKGKIQFQASKAGKNQFRVHVMSNSFIGSDTMKDYEVSFLNAFTKEEIEKMKTEEKVEEEEEEEEESIFSLGNKKEEPASDSEDDS